MVLSGILVNLFSSVGVVNQLLMAFGLDTISPLTDAGAYRWFIWLSNIWKETGWGSIIYLAAIAGIVLNAVLPGNTYDFGSDPDGDKAVVFKV